MITDETQVPPYDLPDPLVFENGKAVGNAADWQRRRLELIELFAQHVYGITPEIEIDRTEALVERDDVVLDGKARRSQTRLTLAFEDASIDIDLLAYFPAHRPGPFPVVLIPNFRGNHTVSADAVIRVSERAQRDLPELPSERGVMAHRFPIEQIVARGFHLVTYYCGDVLPDLDDLGDGSNPLFPHGEDGRAGAEWGAIGTWAWGASRVLDHLLKDPHVDSGRVFVAGHSRLGKMALWAAAQDQRFAGAFANNSGCTGAALGRRRFGETVSAINEQFPHWFCRNYHAFAEREDQLPVDQHELIATIAPRPVYVASAAEDLRADPRGEYLGALHAGSVYRLLGCQGLTAEEWPPRAPSSGKVGYHLRAGGHDLLEEDWIKFLDFIAAA